MKTVITIAIENYTKEDIHAVLQAVRDCEMANFPDKNIYVAVDAPELSTGEMKEVLESINPPYSHGPFVFEKPPNI